MYCIVALLLGMLLANMLKNVCGCKNVVEGQHGGCKKDDYEQCTFNHLTCHEEDFFYYTDCDKPECNTNPECP